MSPARKRAMFDLLVQMGYKEIEVGFPASGQTDFDFVRSIIEEGRRPRGRDHLRPDPGPRRTDRAHRRVARGAHRATVHMYNATAPVFRRVVFRSGRGGASGSPSTAPAWSWSTPRSCSATRRLRLPVLAGDLHRHRAGVRAGGLRGRRTSGSPRPGREIILNLPATVERSTPGTHADRFEWMCRHLSRREHVASRSTRTTTAGAPWPPRNWAHGGRGPRGGLPVRPGRAHGQRRPRDPRHQPVQPGHRPAIDFSDIDEVRRTAEYCNQMDVHRATPTAGTSSTRPSPAPTRTPSRRASRRMEEAAAAAGNPVDETIWEVPYLPSTRRTSAAPTRPSSGSTRSPARAASPTC